MCFCMFFLSIASLVSLTVISAVFTFGCCEFCCQYRYNWLPGKTHLENDLLPVECDVARMNDVKLSYLSHWIAHVFQRTADVSTGRAARGSGIEIDSVKQAGSVQAELIQGYIQSSKFSNTQVCPKGASLLNRWPSDQFHKILVRSISWWSSLELLIFEKKWWCESRWCKMGVSGLVVRVSDS